MKYLRNRRTLTILAALVALFGIFSITASANILAAAIPAAATAALGMVVPAFGLRDQELSATIPLPAAPGTAVTPGIDLGITPGSHFKEQCELVLSAPALTVGELADASTVVYDIFHAATADFSDEVALSTGILTQTGAGGVGAAAATARLRLPTNVSTHIRAKATTDVNDASAKSVVIDLLF